MSTILGKALSRLFFDQGDGKRTIQTCALSSTKPTDAEIISTFGNLEGGKTEPLEVTIPDGDDFYSINCAGYRNIRIIVPEGVTSINLEQLLPDRQYILKIKSVDGGYTIYGNSVPRGIYPAFTGQSDNLTPNAGKVDIIKVQTVGQGKSVYFSFFQQNLVS